MSDPIKTWDLILTEAGLSAALAAKDGGFAVDITHLAAGDAGYDVQTNASGRTSQTTLQNERQRVAISEAVERGNGQTSIAAVFDGPGDFYVREIGLFLDDGTLYAVVSKTAQAMFWKSGISTGYVTVDLVLGAADPDNVQVIVGGAPIQLVTSDIREDLSGVHDPNGQFNFALTRNNKEHLHISMEQFELMEQIRRGYGQSGVRFGRHYSQGGDAPYHRPSAVSFAALGVHNHPNFPMMCGVPEITAVVNGHEVNTRHIDYNIVHSVGGAYLRVEDAIPPAVPASVSAQPTPEAQIAEMAEFIHAFGAKDPSIRDYRPHFDTYLSALEVWLEELDGDALADTFPSFRHQLANAGHKKMNDDYMALLSSGLKSRFENDDFKPTVVRVMRPDGAPQFAVLRYRVSAVRLGTYGEYPVHEMVSQVDDPATRLAKGMTDAEIDATRLGRFRVNHAIGDPSLARRFDPGLLDEIMGKVPGLDGLGATIHEEYTDTNTAYNPFIQRLLEFKTSGRMNSAFYRRFYSYESPGAAGRRHYRFGYNDPMLFRAASSQSQVVALPGMGGNHRISWAIPLELIVATPLSPFNPYNIALLDHPPSGGGRTSSSPLTHAYKLGSFYMLPIDMFDGGASDLNDVADTDEKRWVLDGNGTPRFLRGSGVYIHLPHLNGRQARLRWPIAPVHHEGSFEFGHFEAVRKETQGAIAAMADAITDMKHTARYGGNNGS